MRGIVDGTLRRLPVDLLNRWRNIGRAEEGEPAHGVGADRERPEHVERVAAAGAIVGAAGKDGGAHDLPGVSDVKLVGHVAARRDAGGGNGAGIDREGRKALRTSQRIFL